jgi:hypothetical protein
MDGYQANAELERRKVHDWAGGSRPQVYFSIEKLARLGPACACESEFPPRILNVASSRRRSKAARPCQMPWNVRSGLHTQRGRPPFLTGIALPWQARPRVFRQQIERFRGELHRLRRLKRELPRRAAAEHTA